MKLRILSRLPAALMLASAVSMTACSDPVEPAAEVFPRPHVPQSRKTASLRKPFSDSFSPR